MAVSCYDAGRYLCLETGSERDWRLPLPIYVMISSTVVGMHAGVVYVDHVDARSLYSVYAESCAGCDIALVQHIRCRRFGESSVTSRDLHVQPFSLTCHSSSKLTNLHACARSTTECQTAAVALNFK